MRDTHQLTIKQWSENETSNDARVQIESRNGLDDHYIACFYLVLNGTTFFQTNDNDKHYCSKANIELATLNRTEQNKTEWNEDEKITTTR